MDKNKLTDQHRRVLCEMIGEHFYEDGYDCDCGICNFCNGRNRTFTCGNDMMAVKEAIEREKKWHEFWRWTHEKFRKIQEENNRCVWLKSDHTAWLLEPERFFYLAAEWKGGKG